MVIFDQLRVSDNGKELYINAHVNSAPAFADRYIQSVTILTADKISETNPWNVYEDAEYIYQEYFDEPKKEISVMVTPQMTTLAFNKNDFSNDLFFVYIRMVGTADECVPCYMATDYTVGVTFDETVLYQRVMDYTKSLVKDCSIPSGFIDFILLWNAFKASIETDHFITARKFYDMLFGKGALNSPYGSKGIAKTKSCGCHG